MPNARQNRPSGRQLESEKKALLQTLDMFMERLHEARGDLARVTTMLKHTETELQYMKAFVEQMGQPPDWEDEHEEDDV